MLALSAAADCDEQAFRAAMAAEDLPRFEALVAACRQAGGDWTRRDDGSSLLLVAAHVGGRQAPAFMRRLLAAGADPLAATAEGTTAMHMAARFDCAACIAVLHSAGAALAPREVDGLTPLHMAGPRAAEALVAAGADPWVRDDQGNLPMHRLPHAVLQVADVNVRNAAGLTPLHFAALTGSVWRIDQLLAAGADPGLRTQRDTHWRALSMSRAFGPGIAVPAGSTAYDLARAQQKATRWNTQTHDAAVQRLAEATPRRGIWGWLR